MVLNDLECTVHKVQTGSGRQNLRPSTGFRDLDAPDALPNLTTSPRLWPTFTPKAPDLRNCLLKLSMDSYGLSQHSCRMLISDGSPPNNFWIHFRVDFFKYQVLNKIGSIDFN